MVQVGDRVKLVLNKERGPDSRWHGETGIITRITANQPTTSLVGRF